jgi:hypothetical protein
MRPLVVVLCAFLSVPHTIAQLQSSTAGSQPTASCKRFFASSLIDERTLGAEKTVPTDEKELLSISTSRACMISFWVRPDSWPEDKAYHGEGVTADEMRSLRDSVEAYSEGKYLPSDKMQAHLLHLARKYQLDIRQHLLFGDFVLLQKLMGEDRYEEASREGSRIIKKRHLEAKAVPWTEADEKTYVSSDNLANLIILATAQARCKTPVKSPSDELRFLVDYLDWRPQLVHAFERFGKPDSTEELVQRVADRTWYHFDEPSWTREERLSKLPFVVGATEYNHGFLLLLEGRHAYAIDAQENKPTMLLTGVDAADAYNRSLSAELGANSTTDMQLFGVSRFGSSYEINVGGKSTVSLTAQELATLKTGTPLPPDHALTKLVKDSTDTTLVLYTNPLMLRDTRQRQASDDVAFALSKAYPEAQIVRDPFSDKTKDQVKRLRELGVSASAKTVAVVAEDSFGVTDHKLVQNLEDELRARDIDVVPVSKASIQWTQSGGKLVLVITGHIDAKLAGFVRALGKAGVFQDNYVVFNSCRAKLSRQLATEMTTQYNANAVFVYDSLVTTDALEPVLKALPATVEEKSDRPFWQVWRETVREHKLNGVWTVCENLFRFIAEPA